MKTNAPLALLSLTLALPGLAADLPPLELPAGVGVNIHFTRGHEKDLDMIAAAGFKFIRMDFGWGGIERKKGEYDWSAYDDLTADLEKRGMRAVYIFDYSNGLYEDTTTATNPLTGRQQRDTASPHQPESVAAYARWAAAAAAHFKGRRVVWEIWNEPNISFWKPKPNADDYATLALATCKAVRAADPDATIMGPASSEFPWPFFETLFKAGALEHLDAVSVHPYRNYSRGPETAAEEYLRLRSLIERHAPAAKKGMPIVSGEWGYATQTKGGVPLETQAAFIARQQIANVWQGVPISIWYDWKNDGDDPAYGEHNFGTVSNNLAFKPAYVAVRTLTRELGGFRIGRRLATDGEHDFVFLLVDKSGRQRLAAWTAGAAHPVTIDLGVTGGVRIVTGQGTPAAAKVEAGRLTLDLTPAPQYITLDQPSRRLQAAGAWAIDGFVPTLVQAGTGSFLTIPVKLRNPFSMPVEARIDVASPAGTQTEARRLAPNQEASAAMHLKPRLRTAEAVPYTVTVGFSEKSGAGSRLIGSSGEQREFLAANPLVLSLQPVEAGFRMLLENPGREAFTGTVTFNGRRTPISIPAGSGQKTAQLDGGSSGSEAAVSLELLDENGQAVIEPVRCRFQAVPMAGLKASLDGDAKVPATATVTESVAPGGGERPFEQACKLDYSFEAGWRFVQVVKADRGPITLEGTPKAFGIWVYSDGSGNALRMRFTDGQHQTFQPAGPNLTWSGWRWVQFDLRNLAHAGHWGGPNDGVARGKLTLDSFLLVDGSRKKTGGSVWVAGPKVVY